MDDNANLIPNPGASPTRGLANGGAWPGHSPFSGSELDAHIFRAALPAPGGMK